MIYQVSNNAISTLAANVLAGDNSLTLAGGGASFPPSGIFQAILAGADYGSPFKDPTHEIVTASFNVGQAFNLVARGQEGTQAKEWYAGDTFALIFSAAGYNALVAEIAGKTPLPQIIPETANAALTAAQCNGSNTFTNAGSAGDVAISLPPGAPGLVVSFLVVAGHYLEVQAVGNDSFFYMGTAGNAGGYIRTNVQGTYWRIMWDDTRWAIIQLNGLLSFDQ